MAVHTFGGVQFRTIQEEGQSVPAIVLPGESVIVTEHIPGGDNDISQDLGRRGVKEETIEALILNANWAAFLGFYTSKQVATLAMIGNPTAPALLPGRLLQRHDDVSDRVRWHTRSSIRAHN